MAETDTIGTVRQVIVPVPDVSAAVPFFRDRLGLELRFQDGERWAAFALGELTLALAGPGEQPDGERIALGVKVADLEGAVEQLRAGGGELVDGPRRGEHETRAAWRTPDGTTLALYQPNG